VIPALINIGNGFLEFDPNITQMMQCFRVRLDWDGFGWQLVCDHNGVLLEHAARPGWSELPIPTDALSSLLPGIYRAVMDDYVVSIGAVFLGMVAVATHPLEQKIEYAHS
jgi:hypothetical protein